MNLRTKVRNAIAKIRIKLTQYKNRRKLNNKNFSIISNNCWAGTAVYQPCGLKYTTPTVGLFIMDEDYIRFLENLEDCLTSSIIFIHPEESKYYDIISKRGGEITYPIGRLRNDVEIHFLHYRTPAEAEQKWHRRAKRVNRDRMLIKMSLRNTASDSEELISRFEALKYRNKICFVPIPITKASNCVVYVPELKNLNLVGGDETQDTLKTIDIYKLLNSMI